MGSYVTLSKGAFTIDVRDSKVESTTTVLCYLGLKPSCHENFILSLTFT